MQKKYVTIKKERKKHEHCKYRYEKRNFHPTKRFAYNNKNKEKNSTIEKKYDKHGNKVSMYETVK